MDCENGKTYFITFYLYLFSSNIKYKYEFTLTKQYNVS